MQTPAILCASRVPLHSRTLLGSADGVIIGFDDAEQFDGLFTAYPLLKVLAVSVQANKTYHYELVSAPQGARRALRRSLLNTLRLETKPPRNRGD